MSPERWRAVKRVVQDALALPAAARVAFLDRACTGDATLRREVESLLAASASLTNGASAADFLERPAAAVLAVGGRGAPNELRVGPEAPAAEDAAAELERLNAALAGRYAVERELGRGGMAVVYVARDLRTPRTVALKVLRPELAASVVAGRFRREVGYAARLQHPHVVPLLEAGEDAGALWFAMPYVRGETLRHRLDREGRLPVADAVRIAREVARALDYAHREGVVHRDVKPENVLLSDGLALVADFGVAKALDESRNAEPAAADGAPTRTATGFVLGTPAYMAPEQAAGSADVDGRADVYALGVVLYEMLAGARPVADAATRATSSRRADAGPVPLGIARPETPTAVVTAVHTALAPAPGARFATAAAFAAALTAGASKTGPVVRGLAAVAHVVRPRPRRALRSVALAVAGVLWASTGAGPVEPSAPEPPVASSPVAIVRTAIAVLPFRTGRSPVRPRLDGDFYAQLLYGEFARWDSLHLVDDMRVADARKAAGAGDLTLADAERLAERLGAGRYVVGEVSERDGVTQIDARLHDRSGARTVAYAVRVGPGDDVEAKVAELADSLVARWVGVPRAGASTPTMLGTRNYEALRHYAEGHRHLREWDMSTAAQHFRAALVLDPDYAGAQFALAQTLAWSPGARPASWQEAAAQAVNSSPRLGARDRALAAALLALAEGRAAEACDTYRRLLLRTPDDFAAQFGLGECLARDHLVVRDPSAPTGWRFRSSLAEATAAYRRALRLVPSYLGAARGEALAALTRHVLLTETTSIRRGFTLAPVSRDTVWMGAYPELTGDTISFAPTQIANLFRRAEPPSHAAAVAKDRETLQALTAQWVALYPRSAVARRRHAEALEVAGRLEDPAAGIPGALRAAQDARRLGVTDAMVGPEEASGAAATEVRILLKLGRFADARRAAETALATHADRALRAPAAGGEAEVLAALAALTGRAHLASRLLERAAGYSGREMFWSASGLAALPPTVVLRAAGAFAAYAAVGGPDDSLRATHARVEEAITRWARAGTRDQARTLVLGRNAVLAQPALGSGALRTLPELPRTYDEHLPLWRSLARGDTGVVRRAVAAKGSVPIRGAPRTPEWLVQRAHLALAVRDTVTARAVLDEVLAALRDQPARLTEKVTPAAAFGRALSLRARIAVPGTPTEGAAARAAAALWADADPGLRPAAAPGST